MQQYQQLDETGPYGFVCANIYTGWFPRALGSLWDASWAAKPPTNYFGPLGPPGPRGPIDPVARREGCRSSYTSFVGSALPAGP